MSVHATCREYPGRTFTGKLDRTASAIDATSKTLRVQVLIPNRDLPMLLPGIKVNTSPTDFAPVEQEQLARFNGEKWELYGEMFDAFRKQ